MFRVVIEKEINRTDPVFLASGDGRNRSPVGYSISIELMLPFVPFFGLQVVIPSKDEERDGDYLKIEVICWHPDKEYFWCSAEEDAYEYESPDLMVEDADAFERDGFKVDRQNMCLGEWEGLSPYEQLSESI